MAILWLCICALSVALCVLSRRYDAGWQRLILCSLVLALICTIPHTIAWNWASNASLWWYCWMTFFKIAAFCFARGPLDSSGLLDKHFLVIAFMPVFPSSLPPEDQEKNKVFEPAHKEIQRRWLEFSVRQLVFISLLPFLPQLKAQPSWMWHSMVAFFIMQGANCQQEPPALMAQWLTGIQMMKPHPLPGVLWPEKLGRFWSVFWGPANSAIWRVAIYEPIVQGCWVATPASKLRKGSKTKQAIGVFAVFATSGLLHEALEADSLGFVEAPVRVWSGRMLCFFLAQAAYITLYERGLVFGHSNLGVPTAGDSERGERRTAWWQRLLRRAHPLLTVLYLAATFELLFLPSTPVREEGIRAMQPIVGHTWRGLSSVFQLLPQGLRCVG